MSGSDDVYMLEALDLARRYDGKTGMNPSVGAVLVKDGKVIGRGFHRGVGSLHAELVAINKARKTVGPEGIRGSELFVTLEPCDSWGNTPPCTLAIEEFGISRVVVGSWDPNPVNYRRSLRLRKKGIRVERIASSELRREIDRFYRPFRLLMEERRPFVVVKVAQTLDGKIGDRRGRSKWITSERTRRRVHRDLRARVDAVLTGIGTVERDDPQLTLRWGRTSQRLVRVVLDTQFRISPEARLMNTVSERTPLWVFVGEDVSSRKIARFKAYLAKRVREYFRVFPVPVRDGRVDLEAVMGVLFSQGIARVLVEAGAGVVSAFFGEGLVDRLVLCTSKSLLGRGMGWLDLDLGLEGRVFLRDVRVEDLGEDLWIEGDLG